MVTGRAGPRWMRWGRAGGAVGSMTGWLIWTSRNSSTALIIHLMVKAVEANTDQPWVVLYVKRWLVAPIQHSDGSLHERNRGTPQGSAVSPVLANLFLHYAFDTWMAPELPGRPVRKIRG